MKSDLFDTHPSVTILPVTTERRDTPLFRIAIEPSPTNGLLGPSQVMVDKAQMVPREKVGSVIGRLADSGLIAVNRAPVLFIGFA